MEDQIRKKKEMISQLGWLFYLKIFEIFFLIFFFFENVIFYQKLINHKLGYKNASREKMYLGTSLIYNVFQINSTRN